MKYFRLRDDVYFPNRWYLGDILGVDNWELRSTVFEFIDDLELEISQDGDETDFTETNAYGVPIVSEKLKNELWDFSEIAFVKLKINKRICSQHYYAMIIKNSIDCVNEDKSEFEKFEENDPVRPDKAGCYRAFFKLQLDTEKIINTNIFRLKKFEVAIIVNEKVKEKFEKIGATGASFLLAV